MTRIRALALLVLPLAFTNPLPQAASAQSGATGPSPRTAPSSAPSSTLAAAPLPDPALRAALARLDALEQQNRTLTGRVERLEFELAGAKRDAAEKDQRIDLLSRQITALEDDRAAPTSSFADIASEREGGAGPLSPDTERSSLLNAPAASGSAQGEASTSAATSSTQAPSTQAPSSQPAPARPAGPGVLGTLPAENLPGEAGPMFREAKNQLLRGDYPGAERAFETFIERYPNDPSAPDAQFWLGETLFVQQAYGQAAQSYITLLRDWPDSLQAPNALVKLAASFRELGEPPRACAALDQLKRSYPNAPASILQRADAERARSSCR